jgi:uncharacterized protein (DUF2147 family)
MRQFIYVFGILFFSISAHAQSDSDRLIGVWLNHTGQAKIEMFEKDGKYFGKIAWIANPNKGDGKPHKDINNRDPELRSKEFLGMKVVTDLEYDEGKWVGGQMHVPQKGKTLDCKMEISKNNEELKVTIYKGILFTKTVTWKRIVSE